MTRLVWFILLDFGLIYKNGISLLISTELFLSNFTQNIGTERNAQKFINEAQNFLSKTNVK